MRGAPPEAAQPAARARVPAVLVLLALIGAALAAAGVAFAVWRSSAAETCTDAPVLETRAPDGRFLAAVYTRRCGGGLQTTQVSLRRWGAPFAPRDADIVFTAAGREPLALSWTADPEALVVETRSRAVLREVHHWRTLGVRVRRLR